MHVLREGTPNSLNYHTFLSLTWAVYSLSGEARDAPQCGPSTGYSFMSGLVWICLRYTDLFVQTLGTCMIMDYIIIIIIIIICNMIGK